MNSDKTFVETDLIKKAREFAVKHHGDQLYGDQPYAVHLEAVYNTLVRHGCTNENLLAAAWLHDVIEDTHVTAEFLLEYMPVVVVMYVEAVTTGPGSNRKERNLHTYPRTRMFGESVQLKLADRISNVRASLAGGSKLYGMYSKEYPDFRAALYRPKEFDSMWQELDYLMGFVQP
jgi:guanosine-3',5'-bis(diphosphate) 3'-pyrophosphohydrolase